MRGMLGIFLFIGLAALCWGGYGPVLQTGQKAMAEIVDGHPGPSSPWRPFACVGVAYFLLAVLIPGAMLVARGEKGAWTVGGSFWSVIAGAAGALGALGIIMAFRNHGSPLYVMPLVFGGAPVVNTFLTMSMNKSYREVGPLFLAGLILVVSGAATVLVFRPHGSPSAHKVVAAGDAKAPESPASSMQAADHSATKAAAANLALVGLWTAVTAASWGVYGPVLHKGQMKMAGSRLRPLMCVGVAYFLIAVIIPAVILSLKSEPGQWNAPGIAWSLGGGAAGALGAIGIIMAFNFGGKPIYVMPLVFGVAPVVNTFVTILSSDSRQLTDASPFFYAGLIIVAVGAVVVLVFAPKPKSLGHGHAAHAAPEPAKA